MQVQDVEFSSSRARRLDFERHLTVDMARCSLHSNGHKDHNDHSHAIARAWQAGREERQDCNLSQWAFEMEMESESDCSILRCRTASTSGGCAIDEDGLEHHDECFSLGFDLHLSALDMQIDLYEDTHIELHDLQHYTPCRIASSHSDPHESAPSCAPLRACHPKAQPLVARPSGIPTSPGRMDVVGPCKVEYGGDAHCGRTPLHAGVRACKSQGC